FANSSPMPFVNGIKAARERIVARTDDERTDFLRKRGFGKSETAKIIETVLAEEGRKPESVFDFAQGITAVARDKPHQDARLDLEARAKKLLDRAACRRGGLREFSGAGAGGRTSVSASPSRGRERRAASRGVKRSRERLWIARRGETLMAKSVQKITL